MKTVIDPRSREKLRALLAVEKPVPKASPRPGSPTGARRWSLALVRRFGGGADGTNGANVRRRCIATVAAAALGLGGFLPTPGSAAVVINELLASNVTANPDNTDFDDFSDWIEIANTGASPADLTGYFLTDRPDKPFKWAVPAGTTVPGNGFLLVWADGFDAAPGEEHTREFSPWDDFRTRRYHSSFKLSESGEWVGLYRSTTPPRGVELVRLSSAWRYFDLGTDPGSGWAAPGFADLGWAEDTAEFGYGEGGESTVLDFGDSSSDKHAAYYFRRRFAVADPGALTGPSLRVLADDGAVVYINGEEVARFRMGPGSPSFRSYASATAEEDTFDRVALDPGHFRAGENTIAVEVHQRDGGSSDVSFDLELTATVIDGAPEQVDSVSFGHQTPDVSLGRSPADPEGGWQLFGEPTPGGPNTTAPASAAVAAYRPCALYLNGEYWGIHNVRGRHGDQYFFNRYQIQPGGYDLLKVEHTIDGTELVVGEGSAEAYLAFEAFATGNDLSATEDYQAVAGQMDVDSFMDYAAMVDFVYESSWHHNQEFWRERAEGAKWRWTTNDIDRGFRRENTTVRSSYIHPLFTGDGVNVKGGAGRVEDSTFLGNESPDTDAIDFDDVVGGVIRGNRIYAFQGSNSDAIDVGEGCVDLLVSGNRIYNISDKGVSVGQGSTVRIERNLIVGCSLGAGIKDTGSTAVIDQNTFAGNGVGVAVFEKNLGAGGGAATVTNCIFSRSKDAPATVDALSSLAVAYCLSDTVAVAGVGNRVADPGFVFPSEYDFSLLPGGPAENTGDPAHAVDPDGSRADIGAYYRYDPDDYPFLVPNVIVINELLAHSEGGAPDWIELFNSGSAPVDLGGWFLSDSASELRKYEIAAGTTIPGGGYLVLYQDAHFGAGSPDPGAHVAFALSENGETVYLFKPGDGLLLDYLEAESFGPSAGRLEQWRGTGRAFVTGRHRRRRRAAVRPGRPGQLRGLRAVAGGGRRRGVLAHPGGSEVVR